MVELGICLECKRNDDKAEKKLFKCEYCGNYFCSDHIKPKMVLTLKDVNSEKEPMSTWLEKEFRRTDGHPDAEYTSFSWNEMKRKETEEIEKMSNAMDNLQRSRDVAPLPERTNFNKHWRNRQWRKRHRFPYPKERYNPRFVSHTPSINHEHASKLKDIWNDFGITLKSFLKYILIFFVLLTLANLFLIGKFDITSIIIRSIGFTLFVYLLKFVHQKSRHYVPWKWLIIAALVILIAYLYTSKNYSVLRPLDKIVGIENFTDITILPILNYFQNINQTSATNDVLNISNSIKNSILPQPIDSKWINSFMSEINTERTKNGFRPLIEAQELDAVAYSRFNTMITHPEISHYGAGTYNVGEVVFYPSGSTPQGYVTSIQNTAPLHWKLLDDPSFSYYGYYVGTGPTIATVGYCATTEIPGPNINVIQFFQQQGCQTETITSTWLVIDLT